MPPRTACATETKRSEWMSALSLLNTGLFWTWMPTENTSQSITHGVKMSPWAVWTVNYKSKSSDSSMPLTSPHTYIMRWGELPLRDCVFLAWVSCESITDARELVSILTLNVMKISFLPTGILTVWPSSTPKSQNKKKIYIRVKCKKWIVSGWSTSLPLGLNRPFT